MLTKWGRKLLNVPSDNAVLFNTNQYMKGCIQVKDTGGDTYYVAPEPINDNIGYVSGAFVNGGSGSSYGIAVGSGDTPATENDYTLETKINTLTATSTSIAQNYDSTTGKLHIDFTVTLSNSTASDIVVKEVARVVRHHRADHLNDSISTNSSYTCIMIDRTVLETPLTVPASDIGILRYRLTYDVDAATT